MAVEQALAYYRVSGLSQVEGDGFSRQSEAVLTYAAANKLWVVGSYKEEGIKGTSEWGDRPAWIRMIQEAGEKGVRVVIVETLGRLSRELFIQEHILRDLRKRGIRLLAADGSMDGEDEDPMRKMLRQIIGSIHEYDRSMIVAKLGAARKRKREAGERCDGQKPYGEHLKKPWELAIRERILERHKAGATLTAIAAELNGDGITARHGKKWWQSGVGNVVRAAAAREGK